MRSWILIILLSFSFTLSAQQKVGVVLSGGGAKGIAHIGVLKALEENEIPIDYIVGTSMGGIVGGAYAAGYSPAQLEELFLSPEFLHWINGRFEEDQVYYYYRNDDKPSFMRLNLSLDSAFTVIFNSSIAKDLSLNFALAEKMAQPSAIAKNNFDSLFVPLRVMAADIFTQNEVILGNGSLNDAMRATQTVPFFYNPIRIDGKYLFDGGVYNNFPVDVAQKVFNPDVIIGSNVSSKVFESYPYGQDDKLITKSLLFMILDKSDPSSIPPHGVYIQPNLGKMNSFDFDKARALIDSGYTQTIRQLKEIRSKVSARKTCEEVADARNRFNNRTRPLQVEHINPIGFSKNQRKYISRFFSTRNEFLTFSDVQSGFYRLVSEDYFNNLYPSFSFNTASNRFDLNLSKRPQNNFQVDFGGVIATRSVSNIFLGLNYYYFNRVLTHAEANFSAGSFYKSAELKARIDLPNRGQFYLEPEAVFNTWNFFEGNDWIIRGKDPTILNRIDRKVGAKAGIPVGKRYRFTIGSSYINNRDLFTNADVLSSKDTLDVFRLKGYRSGLAITNNSLNRKQYASEGKRIEVVLDWFSLRQSLDPGSTSIRNELTVSNVSFLRAKFSIEQYFIKAGPYRSGYLIEAAYTNQPGLLSYRASLVNAPAFQPLQDSRSLFLKNYRAYSYLAGGMRNVFTIAKSLDLRLEGYIYKPLQSLVLVQQQNTRIETNLSEVYFIASSNLVLHSTVGPVSLSFNYYNDAKYQFGVLLHVGYLLFKNSSIE